MPKLPSCVLLVLTALSTIGAGATALQPLSIESIERRIQEVGPKRAVQDMSEAQFDAVLQRAETGDPRWLQLVQDLRPGTDAAYSEGIDIAISNTLQSNAAAVLRLIRDRRPTDVGWICQDRAIEPSADQVRRFQTRAIKAVRNVRDPALHRIRAACLASLEGRTASAR